MAGQVNEQHQPDQRQSPDTPEARLRSLEDAVGTLIEAVRVLAQGLEDLPGTDLSGERPARAAGRAHDLLVASKLALEGNAHSRG